MCAGRHQEMPQLVCDSTPEQRSRIDAGLLGHPVDTIDVDRREHATARLRVEHRVAKRQHAPRAVIHGAGADDSNGKLAGCERRFTGTRADLPLQLY
jgi:hypothetical protein